MAVPWMWRCVARRSNDASKDGQERLILYRWPTGRPQGGSPLPGDMAAAATYHSPDSLKAPVGVIDLHNGWERLSPAAYRLWG